MLNNNEEEEVRPGWRDVYITGVDEKCYCELVWLVWGADSVRSSVDSMEEASTSLCVESKMSDTLDVYVGVCQGCVATLVVQYTWMW